MLEALAAVPEGARLPWYGPPMSVRSFVTARLMETWAHGQDVVDALGRRPPADGDRLRHVCHLGVAHVRVELAGAGRGAAGADGPCGSSSRCRRARRGRPGDEGAADVVRGTGGRLLPRRHAAPPRVDDGLDVRGDGRRGVDGTGPVLRRRRLPWPRRLSPE